MTHAGKIKRDRLRVYVAGPYSASSIDERVANVETAIDAALDLLKRGHIPFIPHLTHYVDVRAAQRGLELGWRDYLDWDLAWLAHCDAILYLGASPGADEELAAARRTGKYVFKSLLEVPTAERL